MEGITPTIFLLALSGGFLPILVWLWFWLKEDSHPEPRKILFLTFFYGMLATIVALATEYTVSFYIKGAIALMIWAFAEEILKYFAARLAALKKPFFDEPIDALVYMITAALGFSMVENILFILSSFKAGGIFPGFITGNLRFIGATLLHTTTSALVGASIAFSFFHKEKMKYNIIGGLILSGFLHFIFNYFIIKNSGENILKLFIPLWLGIIIIIFVFEKVKRIKS